ncbi:MAG: hypothetical protein CMO01_21245 [Thalassobius sp.]|nr:hypothetical protein [Thalassovita sp.]
MDCLKRIVISFLMIINYGVMAQNIEKSLSNQEESLIKIAACTSKGDLVTLKDALVEGLDSGLTISQINDVLAQLYAYCGFPRSLNAINTFMKIVEERKNNGIIDSQGETAKQLSDGDKYETGRKRLEELTGQMQLKPAPGFGEFNPVIDKFLKEHLFADIFDSDLLSYKDRELATISALSMIEGAEPQLQAHFGIGLHVGISKTEMNELLQIVSDLQKFNTKELSNPAEIEFLKFQLNNDSLINVEHTEKHLIRISEIEIHTEFFEEYITILKEESSASVLKEPGVISIFPLIQKQNPTQIRILEFYKDQDAYKAHIASDHFKHYKTSTLHMVKDLKLIDMYVIDAQTMSSIFKKLK